MDHFKSLLNEYPVKSFSKGEIILYQGEVPEVAFAVKSGLVRAYDISSDGSEKPIAFKKALEIFPTAWLFKKSPATLYFYEAYTDVQVHALPREEFWRLITNDKLLVHKLLDDYVTISVAKSLRINALQYSKAADKMIHILEYLMVMYGRELKNGKVVIELPIIQQELANLLGITRETAVIQLSKLKQEGILTQSHRKIIINKTRFSQYLGESEFLGLTL
ncbi:MAG TPA: Crp/Fnr family transcriptional regulator [Candidatus Saccharimonadales bacterium]|nr:Crp/Fnr family transcriptional regulator [Candidatus Saccharimonadales bacterium]